MKTVHYVATLQIKRVEHEDTRESSGRYATVPGAPKRTVGDVASLVIRGADLDLLKQKLKDHLLIMEDDLSVPLDDADVMCSEVA